MKKGNFPSAKQTRKKTFDIKNPRLVFEKELESIRIWIENKSRLGEFNVIHECSYFVDLDIVNKIKVVLKRKGYRVASLEKALCIVLDIDWSGKNIRSVK